MTTDLRLKVLSSDEVSLIFEKCIEFLSSKGVKVEHEGALKMLDRSGARVDFDKQIVCFPRDVIEAALDSAPRDILMAGRDPDCYASITYPRKRFYTATATGNVSYLDPVSNQYRDVGMAYVAEWARLCQALENIDMVFFPFPKDVPPQTADIHALKGTLENTAKHVIIQPYSIESLEFLFELALVASEGNEGLRDRPIISMVSCSVPPLRYKPMDMEALLLAARHHVPLYAASLPSSGATSPMTIAGTVLQNGIEVLAHVTMSQLANPGTPFIANPVAFSMDMAKGKNIIASVEAELCQAACTQFVKEALKLPMAPFGYATDTVLPDGQSMINRLLLGYLVVTAGADIIAEAGQLEAGIASSPVQLIIDDTISSILKRVSEGVRVDEDSLAEEQIKLIDHGGNYLEKEHTLQHCRDALQIGLFVSEDRDSWLSQGGKDLCTRAMEKYVELQPTLGPQELPSHVQQELDRIVKRADNSLVR